jgi:hypothetical protein
MKTTTFYYIRILAVILALAWLTSIPLIRSTSFAKESFHETRVEKEFEDGSIIWSGVSSISNKRREYTILRGGGLSSVELETISKVKEGKVITRTTNRYIGYFVCGVILFPILIPLLFSVSFDSDDHVELNKHRISVYKNILLFFGYSDQEVEEIILYLKENVSLTRDNYYNYRRKGTYYWLIQLTKEFLSTKQN